MLGNAVIFNFHDLALILAVFQSLLLATLLFSIKEGKSTSNRLLALFICAIGLDALDALIYWCVPLKLSYFQYTPSVFFPLKIALLVQGPLLFLYVKSLIYADFALQKRDALHLIPALGYPAYAVWLMHDLGATGLHSGVHNYAVFWDNPYFRGLVFAQALSVLIYALAALNRIIGYKEQLKQNYSNLDKIERNWLKILIVGFSLLAAWNLISLLLSAVNSVAVSSSMGLVGNYLDLLFINFLVFYNLLHSHVVQGVRDPSGTTFAADKTEPAAAIQESVPSLDDNRQEFRAADIAAIEKVIQQDKAYLNHDLTLDQLATLSGLSPRTTSNIINRHFGMSFFDFVNFHRVAIAKEMLLREPDKSVLEIAEMSGFNSKSAFNRFFKKFAGVTPTELRRSQ